jgi:hypothetical protein
MSLIDADYFRSYHKKDETYFPDTQVSAHIPNAEGELIDIVGETIFEAVEALDEQETRTAKEERQLVNFKNALAELTMCSILPGINEVPSEVGMMLGSNTGGKFGEGGFQIASPNQVKVMIEMHYNQAVKLVQRYIPATGGILAAVIDGDDEGGSDE